MTYPAAPRPEAPSRSPFAGQLVHVLAGLRLTPDARQPLFDEGIWDLTGAAEVSVQVAPNILTWDFTKIEHEGWRLVARELLIAVLAPGHEQVLTVPLARRDPLALATCHSRLSAVTTWFQWMSDQGIRDLEQVCWKTDSNGNMVSELDHSDPTRTHMSDALGYLIARKFPMRAQCGEMRGGILR